MRNLNPTRTQPHRSTHIRLLARARCVEALARARARRSLLNVGGIFQTPATWIYRAFVMIVGMPVSRSNKEINAKSMAAFKRVVEVAAEHGWAEYRSPPAFADLVADSYSYNDHALRRFNEQLKDAVDPNGIIAAGRGGIWPRHLRGGRKA